MSARNIAIAAIVIGIIIIVTSTVVRLVVYNSHRAYYYG